MKGDSYFLKTESGFGLAMLKAFEDWVWEYRTTHLKCPCTV